MDGVTNSMDIEIVKDWEAWGAASMWWQRVGND